MISSVSETVSGTPSQIGGGGYVQERATGSQEGKTKLGVNHARTHVEDDQKGKRKEKSLHAKQEELCSLCCPVQLQKKAQNSQARRSVDGMYERCHRVELCVVPDTEHEAQRLDSGLRRSRLVKLSVRSHHCRKLDRIVL